MRCAGVTFALVVLLCLTDSLAQDYEGYPDGYGDGYGYSYDMYYQDMAGTPYEDELGYYSDDDLSYYDYYGYYADDAYGSYEYDGEVSAEECTFINSKVKLLGNNTVDCDIRLSGVDNLASNLQGGVDGIYRIAGCHNGKPIYIRNTTEPRVMYFSGPNLGDWDISKGTKPNEHEIILYGGEQRFHSVPLLVDNWHLGADLMGAKEDDYVPIKAKVQCSDGRKVDLKRLAADTKPTGPLLTHEEIDQKYKYIFDKYSGRPDPNPRLNFTFVLMLVIVGLGVVLAIPYLLLKKKGSKSSVSQSFAQFIQSSRKKTSGHTL